jgi:hypothetical protein
MSFFGITRHFDFVHRLVFYRISKHTMFRKLDLFPSSGEGMGDYSSPLLLVFSSRFFFKGSPFIRDRQKYPFFARDMVAFLVNNTMHRHRSCNFKYGIPLKLRNKRQAN